MSMFTQESDPIPLSSIKTGVNIKNIRTIFDRARVEELAEAIKRDGLMVPLVVMPGEGHEDEDDGDWYELVAGERRLRAIQLICRDDPDFMEDGVPVVLYAGGLSDAKYVNASENLDREDVDAVDVAAWIFGRVQEGVKQGELATRMVKSPAWVSQRVVFHDQACDELKQALRENLLSFTAAYEMAKNLTHEEQIKYVKKYARMNERITVEQAKNAGDQDKEKKPGKRDRKRILQRAEKCADDQGSEIARGLAHALRWVDGDMSDDEVNEILSFEETK